jgi:hypothetical protein
MNPPQNNPCEMLSAWLKVATDRLCDSAKARITLEIEAHFNEAVEAHIADGKPPVEAQAQALAELGNPEKAGRRFRKKHLTEKEVKKILGLMAAAAKPYSKIDVMFEVLFSLSGIVISLVAHKVFHPSVVFIK